MTDDTNSRLGGAVLLLLAIAGMWWTEHDVQTDGSYSAKIAFIAPFAAIMALDFLIHAPKMPMNTMTARDALYAVAGAAAGLLNLNRYGAFSAESSIRTPLFVGLGAVAVYLAFLQVRKQRRQENVYSPPTRSKTGTSGGQAGRRTRG